MWPPKSILHINVTRIGDTLLATPVIRALATQWPDAQITCFGHPKRVELLRHLPFIDQVGGITKNRVWWRGRLGNKYYDLAVVHGFDPELVAYALRVADKVVAFRQADSSLNDRLYRCVVRPVLDSVPAVDIQLALTAALGIEPAGRFLSYCVSGPEQAWALQRLVGIRRPLIGLMVESFPTKPYRDWPIESFIETAKHIIQRYPQAHFVLLGGKLPATKVALIRKELVSQISVFAGALSLRQTAALMANLNLYIGVDTGPTHLAGALEIPMIGLYHCLHRGKWLAPREHSQLVIVEHPAAEYDCSAERCMSEIPVELVVSHALILLEQSR